MAYFPLFLELAQRRCAVIGGGAVAERRVEALVSAGARVTVVSPTATPRIEQLARDSAIVLLRREYRKGDLEGFQLAFVAGDDPEVTREAREEATQRNVWLNAADDPERCDFILPSVLRRGALVVAVGTGGRCPGLARAVREALESHFGPEYEELARIASEVRAELRRRSIVRPAERWQVALGSEIRQLVRDKRFAEARERLLELLA
jgi:siroheme synthase-like protein